MLHRPSSAGRPTSTTWPSTTPCTPRPSTFSNALGREERAGARRSSRRSAHDRGRHRMLRAGLHRAGQAQRLVLRLPSTCTSTSAIRPAVTVPVLSSTTVSTRRVASSTSGPLIRMPSLAPRPVPTSSAVGVARPSAHGQAMISTATRGGEGRGDTRAGAEPERESARSANAITIGTNTPEIRSASRCTGALPLCASSTSFAIWASWVSAPTRVARTISRPPAFTVAPTTASPGPTSTGTDSPVSSAASTAERPSSTTPSVATFSPGRTTNRSPTASRSIGIRSSRPPSAQHRDVLRAQLQQRPQRRPGPPLRAGLEVPARPAGTS